MSTSDQGDFSTVVRLRIDGDSLRDPVRFDKIVANELDAIRRDLEAWVRSERAGWLEAHA